MKTIEVVVKTNRDVYGKDNFKNWAERNLDELYPVEAFLLKKYLTNTNKRVLDAGTGSGRIAFNLEKMGFNDIIGFDFVPEMIERARLTAKQLQSDVEFMVADAVDLHMFPYHYFDYLVYLQQVVCFVPQDSIRKALEQSFAIAKHDAIAVFSFLNWRGRSYNGVFSFFVNTARLLRGERPNRKLLPWLRLGSGFNWNFWRKNQAMTYWVEEEEIVNMLRQVGYRVLEHGAPKKLGLTEGKESAVYVVCQKP